MSHPFQIIVMLLQQVHQISGCPRLKPVAAELHLIKRVQQTERVIDPDGMFHKVVTIITFFQFCAHLLITHLLLFCQLMQFLLQVVMYFFLRDAANIHKAFIHWNILQVIQVAEHAHLAKFCHPGQQRKLDAAVHRLQSSVERLQRIPELLL